MNSSTPYSARLDLALSPSRLQWAALALLSVLPLAIPLLLPLDTAWRAAWIGLHLLAASCEFWRAGLLTRRGRIVRVARRGDVWHLTRADGRRFPGPLRRSWCNAWCAYLEIGDGWRPRSLLVWRDSVSAAGFRHLRTHLRLG